MSKITQIKTNFTAGEVAPDLLGRGDLRAYDNGALALRNLFISPTGGVSRRSGTAYIATAPGAARLIPYEYNTQKTYLLVVSHLAMGVYQDGILIETMATPWTSAQLDQLCWTQSADMLLIVHPDVSPRKITRSTLGVWGISDWSYSKNATGLLMYMPFYRYAASDVTLTASAVSGSVTLTASALVFSSGYVGTRLRVRGTDCIVTAYTSGTTITVSVQGSLPASASTTDWTEQAFSAVRGYPISVAFHQDRLVLGGSRDLPNRLWLSKSGSLFNFDLGTGLDDEAIEFGILSDQVNAIRSVFSGRHLQVFTSGAEWMVTGDPLTPTSLQIKRQTRVGSMVSRLIPPVDVEGATLFAARNGQEIREFLYTDIEQAYQSTDLALLSRHIITTPVDQDYDKTRRLLFVVREDGYFATLTMYRAENVAAWTLHETQGSVKNVAVVGDRVYFLVVRNGAYLIEEIRDECALDSALLLDSPTPQTIWNGLGHLNGLSVKIIADGVVLGAQTVVGGAVTLATAATHVQIGLGFRHVVTPLPPNETVVNGHVHRVRLVRLVLRLQETMALHLDMGRGVQTIPLPEGDPPETGFSGLLPLQAYGWRAGFNEPLWYIESDVPQSFTLLSSL